MTNEKGFIEITDGRWWYEDKVGEIFKVESFLPDYQDDSLPFTTEAYKVLDEDGDTSYVLAQDCREWTRPKLDLDMAMVTYSEEARKEREARGDDMVEHPNHYTTGKFETIELIEAVTSGYEDPFVSYCVGNTQKYIARAPHKGKLIEDLRKAAKYIEFAVKYLEGNE